VKYGQVSGVPYMRDGRAGPSSPWPGHHDLVVMERSLRESEERFRAIFESAQDCIFIKNLDLEYAFVNPCMEKVLGFRPGRSSGRRTKSSLRTGPNSRPRG
jgi:PAS domain-containing protein